MKLFELISIMLKMTVCYYDYFGSLGLTQTFSINICLNLAAGNSN